jgi:hypothetical protein
LDLGRLRPDWFHTLTLIVTRLCLGLLRGTVQLTPHQCIEP